jgi:soluble lytic murein transglycosylase
MTRRWITCLLLVIAFDFGALWYWRWRKEQRFDDLIRAAAHQYQLPPALVKAVVWRESDFDPRSVGKAGEIGLMQLMDEAAHEWAGSMRLAHFAHEDVFDPRTNTLAGSYYLAKLLRRYTGTDDPLPYALADYNAGRGNVLKWMTGPARTNSTAFLNQVGFPSTRAYVQAITGRYAEYRREFR